MNFIPEKIRGEGEAEAEAEVGCLCCNVARSQSLILLIFPGKPEVSILDDTPK